MPTLPLWQDFIARSAELDHFYLVFLAGIVFICISMMPIQRWIPSAPLLDLSFLNMKQDRAIKIIVSLAAALRIPLLGGGMWFDEAFTHRLINTSNFWPALMADVHPPLYYAVLKPLASMPAPVLRSVSLIIGLWGIVLMWRLVRVLGLGDRAALIAAVLMAVMPAHIYYSVELRSYSLVVNLVLAMMLAILQNRPKRFAVWVVALVWTHNAGVFYVAVFAVAALLYHRASKPWLKALLLGGGGAAVWLPFLLQQAAAVSDSHWAYINPGMVFYPILMMTTSAPLGMNALIVTSVTLIVNAFAFIALYKSRGWLFTKRGAIVLVGMLGVPLLEIILSVVWRPTYIWRHMLPAALLLIIPWSYVLSKRTWWKFSFVPVLVITIISVYSYWMPTTKRNYSQWLSESGCTKWYATNINSAFILAGNGVAMNDIAVAAWAQDNGGTTPIDAVVHFGFRVKAGEQSGDCVFYNYNPATLQIERDFIASLLADPLFSIEISDNEHYYIFRMA